jgi:hypothetical protein
MARKYTISSGKTAAPAATVVKVAVSIATGAAVTAVITGADITFDSTATGAGAVPVLVELCRTTAAPSGGSTATPASWRKGQMAAVATARVNDTTDGTSPSVVKSWLVSPTSGVLQQLPLGREFEVDPSDFWELRITPQTGFTACNYVANVDIEE